MWFVTLLHHVSLFVGINAAVSVSRQIQQNVAVNAENVFTVILESKNGPCFVTLRREKTYFNDLMRRAVFCCQVPLVVCLFILCGRD